MQDVAPPPQALSAGARAWLIRRVLTTSAGVEASVAVKPLKPAQKKCSRTSPEPSNRPVRSAQALAVSYVASSPAGANIQLSQP